MIANVQERTPVGALKLGPDGFNKIAILGTAPDWKDAPFDDESWEIWACNRSGFGLKRWDVLFEIHNHFEPEEDEGEGDDRGESAEA